MKKLIKVIRISSKEGFKNLRDKGPIYCKAIDTSFSISNLFLRHISGNATKRSIREIIERLTSINLIEKIASEGYLVETREKVIIEGYDYKKSYKIKLILNKVEFYIILAERFDSEVVIISTFLNFGQK